jgi:hypothetical protein
VASAGIRARSRRRYAIQCEARSLPNAVGFWSEAIARWYVANASATTATSTASAIARDFHESATATSVPRVIEYVSAITPTAAATAPGAIDASSKRRTLNPSDCA